MRAIKFRAWDKHRGESGMMLVNHTFASICVTGLFNFEGLAWMQYTGLKDKNGVEIFTDDLVNVFFTSNDGEHNHDCIYKVFINDIYGIEFRFVKLLWEISGHNQYPVCMTLSSKYGEISDDYVNQNYDRLAVKDMYGENYILRNKWKTNDYSNNIEVIGNIYETPELLENDDE